MRPSALACGCRQTLTVMFTACLSYDSRLRGAERWLRSVGSLVAPLLHLDVLIHQRFLVQHGLAAVPGVLPGADVGELVVVPESLPVLGLGLRPEVPAAGLPPDEGVDAHQLAELEEVRDAPGPLERLVELLARAEHQHVGPELAPQLADPGDGLAQPLLVALHPAVVPH